jgi:hypothetical protein
MDYLHQIPKTTWMVLAGIAAVWLYSLQKKHIDAQRQSEAVNWPLVEGSVHSSKVSDRPSGVGKRRGYSAVFTYAYGYGQGELEDYFTSTFTRVFNSESDAGVWAGALKDKRIPVRVCPDRPRVSEVLVADLDFRFGPPAAEGTPDFSGHAAQTVHRSERLPARYRWPTEMATWLAGLCFVLSLIDHLYRVIAGRPAHPYLAPVLWCVAVSIGVPIWYWFDEKLHLSLMGWPSAHDNLPAWLRICRYLIDVYTAFNWVIPAFRLDLLLHLHPHDSRLDPYSNGVFVMLLFGNALASLFAALDRIEDPSDPATWSLKQE